MAESHAHRFGQLIGEVLESVVLPQLDEFCKRQNLYLDYQKRNRPARKGKKVSWSDPYGNIHDLDFVIERDGSDQQIGRPVAFIETAWRRYTKHSRNKAQEIQGAILPLAEMYRWNNPFLGAVLAGVFTEKSLDQLRSLGFQILYFPLASLVEAFGSAGIDIAFDETTPDEVYKKATDRIVRLPWEKMESLRTHLVAKNQTAIDSFFNALNNRLGRQLTRILVIPLYGRVNEFVSIEDALKFLDGHQIYEGSGDFRKYEIRVEFSNGDKVEASIEAKDKVREFLNFVVRQ